MKFCLVFIQIYYMMLFYFILITMYSTLFLAFCGNVIIILCSNFKKSKNSAVTNIEQAGFQKMKFTYGPHKIVSKNFTIELRVVFL